VCDAAEIVELHGLLEKERRGARALAAEKGAAEERLSATQVLAHSMSSSACMTAMFRRKYAWAAFCEKCGCDKASSRARMHMSSWACAHQTPSLDSLKQAKSSRHVLCMARV